MDPYWCNQTEQSVGHAILTGYTGPLSEMPIFDDFLDLFDGGASVLDFGCGVGRNIRPLASKYHEVVAFDNLRMLSMVPNQNRIDNVRFESDWGSISRRQFSDVCASLCFQHIPVDELRDYLWRMRTMFTRDLIVHSRTWLDYQAGDILPVLSDFFQTTWLKFSEDKTHFIAKFKNLPFGIS